jgi:hypothetical protein
MKKKDQPESVEMSLDEFSSLKSRVESGNLSSDDIKLVIKCLNFMAWFQVKLRRTQSDAAQGVT